MRVLCYDARRTASVKLASLPSARTLTFILSACVPIAIVFSFTIIATLAEVVAVLALADLIARRVDEARAWRASKLSG